MNYAAILEREFRAATNDHASRITVTFDDDESIAVTVGGAVYLMQIGSDDDRFCFTCADRPTVAFDYPPDWFE